MSSPSATPVIPPQSVSDAYNQLLDILDRASPEEILEIDILPSTYPSHIHYIHPALALPKSLLIQLYLHARSLFSTPNNPPSSSSPNDARLSATRILLLFDPAHLTAANYRKRHLQHLSTNLVRSNDNDDDDDDEQPKHHVAQLTNALRSEVALLTSLQTSPLPKHAKASTLWAQRLWLMRTFFAQVCNSMPGESGGQSGSSARGRRLWDRELGVVMRAGERHARNYYAWEYARQVFRLVTGELAQGQWIGGGVQAMVVESLGRVHAWCLMHPRDVSGWGCLVFLLARLGEFVGRGDSDIDGGIGWYESEVGRIEGETKGFVRKYEWRGESLAWFLKSVNQLGISR